jgi:molybdopterin-binding protein
VALARAVAIRPSVLLLDEPFSALDPRRRSDVRRELRQLHRELTMTVLQVTHDFTEAGLLGDVAILLDDGRVLQVGPPNTVFRQPASPYVADFLGADNVLAGEACEVEATRSGARQGNPRVAGVERRMMEFRTGKLTLYGLGDAPGAGHAVIRAEEVLLSMEPTSTSARNMFAGRVVELLTLGALTRVTLDIQGTLLVAALTTRSASDLSLEIGTPVFASFKAMAVHLC